MTTDKNKELKTEQKIYFRNLLREGRADALRDAEGFQSIIFALEKLGKYLNPFGKGLGDYYREDADNGVFMDLILKTPLANELSSKWHKSFKNLYKMVRVARNDALHQGAIARHLTNNCVILALIMEDALMSDSFHASDFMVNNPICAKTWQPISIIRQHMLVNSFTFLPIWYETKESKKWNFISDYHIACYLRSVQSNTERKKRLNESLETAIKNGLTLECGEKCYPDTKVGDILNSLAGKPILVVDKDDESRLLGIVTAFDLI